MGHSYRDAIRYTPRQLYAFCDLAVEREMRKNATELEIQRLARGAGTTKGNAAINKRLKEWTT